MKNTQVKIYRVIAHLVDGDIEIKQKGNKKFSTLNEAVKARKDNLSLCDDIDIVVEI